MGLRGPFGHGWPLEPGRHDVVILAGGIGLAPLRPVVYWLLQHREHCRRVVLLYGCRTPEDRLYADELEQWAANDSTSDVLVTVDNATAAGRARWAWSPICCGGSRSTPSGPSVLVCGPRMLNRVAAWNFLQLHVPPDRSTSAWSGT